MGQFSMEISGCAGSALSGNQQTPAIAKIEALLLEAIHDLIAQPVKRVASSPEAHDFLAKIETGELDITQKRKKLLDAYAEELRCKYRSGRLYKSCFVGCGGRI